MGAAEPGSRPSTCLSEVHVIFRRQPLTTLGKLPLPCVGDHRQQCLRSNGRAISADPSIIWAATRRFGWRTGSPTGEQPFGSASGAQNS